MVVKELMKTCCNCKLEKSMESFVKAKIMKDGYSNVCKACKNIKRNNSRYKYKEKERNYGKKYHANNREKISTRKRNARELKSPEERNKPYKNWATKNKWNVNFIASMKRARKELATPKWLTKEQIEDIKRIYRECPDGYQVDHQVPIKACNPNNIKEHVACGLHVPWNLQYLPSSENARKCNKLLTYNIS